MYKRSLISNSHLITITTLERAAKVVSKTQLAHLFGYSSAVRPLSEQYYKNKMRTSRPDSDASINDLSGSYSSVESDLRDECNVLKCDFFYGHCFLECKKRKGTCTVKGITMYLTRGGKICNCCI